MQSVVPGAVSKPLTPWLLCTTDVLQAAEPAHQRQLLARHTEGHGERRLEVRYRLCSSLPSQHGALLHAARPVCTRVHLHDLPHLQHHSLIRSCSKALYLCRRRYIDNTPAIQTTSNNPYGHWAWSHWTAAAAGNGYLCTAAYSSLAYDKYLGRLDNATDMANTTLFESAAGNADKSYGWTAESCGTTTLGFICNFPISVFSCNPPPVPPPSPPRPPSPPSPPVMPSCELLLGLSAIWL